MAWKYIRTGKICLNCLFGNVTDVAILLVAITKPKTEQNRLDALQTKKSRMHANTSMQFLIRFGKAKQLSVESYMQRLAKSLAINITPRK